MMLTMKMTQTTAINIDPIHHSLGGKVLRRPVRRAWLCGLCFCLLALLPGINRELLAGILFGIAFSIIDLFLMWKGISDAVCGIGNRKRILQSYFVRYLLLGSFLAVVRLASFPAFWGTVAGVMITRGFLVLEGFQEK